MVVLPTLIDVSVHFLFHANITILAFRVLIDRPLVEHHLPIVFTVICVLSQMKSVSLIMIWQSVTISMIQFTVNSNCQIREKIKNWQEIKVQHGPFFQFTFAIH
jgi:hypothetical protein